LAVELSSFHQGSDPGDKHETYCQDLRSWLGEFQRP